MKYLILLIISITMLNGCTTMSDVMGSCGTAYPNYFSNYASCLQSTYNQEGAYPNSPTVQAFYSRLSMLNNRVNNGEISQDQARYYAYNAYMETIDVENRRREADRMELSNALKGMTLRGQN
jgi:hypothetical protein